MSAEDQSDASIGQSEAELEAELIKKDVIKVG